MQINIRSYQHPIIIGAGIAGLSTALSLAHKGIKSVILENRKYLDEVGAGIQLASNATRILKLWGLEDQLFNAGVQPHCLQLSDGKSLKTCVQIDIKETAQRRWNSPYLTIHRSDLQNILYQAVKNNPFIEVKLGENLFEMIKQDNGLTKIGTIIDGKKIYSTSPLIIGCDGVWSQTRQNVYSNETAQFSEFIAWRSTIKFELIPFNIQYHFTPRQTIHAWMRPNSHLVAYPIRSGKEINFVAITKGNHSDKIWNHQGKSIDLLKSFKNWHSDIHTLIQTTGHWTYWPLYDMQNHHFIGQSGQVFVGDASHALLPFAAQGAAMAIEDSAVLAECLASQSDINEALFHYRFLRKKRLLSVKKRGNFNQFTYHVKGPMAIARNFVMKLTSSEKMMSDLDWLYGYDAIAHAKKYLNKFIS
ncbi:FAD-dependent monooxygenase [Bartonella tamiae]|uniref:FAD-binding domain-containing protein n=1 Tax=Bartonella tamiae Th239 TaxID=1094558 RepID=J0ZK20_9HYPH|nr:FAD-dependent monooxygenase [Bartonella tamiae]EJF88678.1 hypothetical protein ME5_01229 [Bartonella tamiae Th239]EJF95072.1 hypothetical protein MEG_00653 [Bartonella tamiae Th307]